MVKRKRNQRILRLFLNGKSLTDIHASYFNISITSIHRIIKQEAYHLTKNKIMKILIPLKIRDIHSESLLLKLNSEKTR